MLVSKKSTIRSAQRRIFIFKGIRILASIIFLMLCFSSIGMKCEDSNSDYQIQNCGSLSLQLSPPDGESSRTILPEIQMSVDHYDISLTGPNNETVESGADSNGTIVIDNLAVGDWLINVTAVNSNNIYIGIGQCSTTIHPYQTSDCHIYVTPFEGHGVLNLTINWDTEILPSATIEGRLESANSLIDPVVFTLTDGTNTHETGQLPVGYYTLTIKLFYNNEECGGAVEVARILAGEITKATIGATVIPGNGGAGIEIIPEMNDPIEITLSGVPASVSEGSTFTASAMPVDTTDVIYTWYIDGQQMSTGASESSYTIPNNLERGTHRLDVTIFTSDGFRGGSETALFNVVE